MDRFFLGGYLSEHLEKCNYKLHFLEKRKLAGTKKRNWFGVICSTPRKLNIDTKNGHI